LDPKIIDQLRAIAGKRVLTSPEELTVYAYDSTWVEHRPDVVVSPLNTQEVSAILKLADEARVPVVPRGAGSGLAGGSVPVDGGIALNLALMNQIKCIDPVDMVAVVEPGVITATLQEAVEALGLFYPPDPASMKHCTLGGNVAMNAGGPRGLKYGVTRDYVLGLEVVVPGGEVLQIGGRAIKKATGYPFTQLFVGSEGTLGVFTEITLKLIPKPQARGALLAVFLRLEDAAASVTKILNSGIMPATIEIMDQITLRTVEEYLKIGLPQDVEAVILVECDGNAEAVAQEVEAIVKLCQANGAREVKRARNAAERDELWKARQSVSPSLSRLKPNKLGEDITVPRSQIVTMVKQIQDIAQRNNVFIALFGHISDGNLHPNIVCDRRDKEEMKRVQQAAQEIFEAAIALKGTLSGEHGIGFLKKEFLPMDLSPQVIELQRRVKTAFDPHNILNPNKIFPTGTLGAIFY